MAKKQAVEEEDFIFRTDEDDAEDGQQPASGGGTGNTEVDALAEQSAVLVAFQQRAAREDERFWDSVDSEYWFAVCFQTREQKEEFISALNIDDLGDKYIDGMELAKRLKIQLQSRIPAIPKEKKDSEWSDMALPFNLDSD